ncbi:MAG: CDP-alcohol phosphatidyltransferase family protein [Bacteroidales bacterium]|nr:CDP-alcohol phosphatidyltransferase family protein [Bacteroidales bacterium]
MDETKTVRIQTSVLNAAEKKVLVWLAERQPRWVTSDMLTFVGTFGAMVIGAGYMLSDLNIRFLWLSTLGFLINWYGDSLDGTLARVRKQQRPIYGFYVDHTMDVVNEIFMFLGIGLSQLVHFDLAVLCLLLYIMLTLNVTTNTHLKGEFRLTYFSLGPTEFRLLMIVANTLIMYVKPITAYSRELVFRGMTVTVGMLDYFALAVLAVLSVIYVVTIIKDMRSYAQKDPLPERHE